MRVLVVNTDYESYVAALYRERPGLAERASEEQLRQRFDTLFGLADFYSEALRALGHEAKDLILNLAPAQRQWARERGLAVRERRRWAWHPSPLGVPVPLYRRDPAWLEEVLAAQVRDYRPDLFYSMSLDDLGTPFLKRIRDSVGLAVGQHASPHSRLDVSGYDLIFSSIPSFVQHYRALGIPSERLRLGFAPRVLSSVVRGPKRHDVVFVGGLGGPHDRRTRLLEALCRAVPVKVWGYGRERLRWGSPLRAVHQGPLWGKAMYQVLADARIVFNLHIDLAGPHANNMRLYETTGVGSFLLTDWKEDLRDLFEPGREVAAYTDLDDCLAKVKHYLAHEDEREEIARRGQERTLRDHDYRRRMEEMLAIVGPRLRAKRSAA